MIKFLKNLLGIKSHDFAQMVRNGAMVIDVRSKGEFAQGHIKVAKNIPLDTINNNVNKIKSSGKPIIAYCRSGNRSGMAARMLKASGIEAYNGGSLGSLSRKLDV